MRSSSFPLRGLDQGIHEVRTAGLPGDNTARIWDAATANDTATLRGHDEAVNSAAFSPDGSRIVTASDDKTARI
jgi:WD40 repeat protein